MARPPDPKNPIPRGSIPLPSLPSCRVDRWSWGRRIASLKRSTEPSGEAAATREEEADCGRQHSREAGSAVGGRECGAVTGDLFEGGVEGG
jgi:hypothetical protein